MKGSVIDVIGIVVIAFALALSVFIGHAVLVGFSEEAPATLNHTTLDKGLEAQQVFDSTFPVIIVLMLAATIIAGLMINTHPAFFIISVIILAICVMVSVAFSNSFYDIHTAAAFTNETSSFSTMIYVMDNLPEILLVMGIVLAIIIYAKYSEGRI